jgi:hypothetical protein
MTDLDTELFAEPSSEGQRAGATAWQPHKLAYYQYMEEEGIPIHTGIGVHDIRELELGNWDRLGARGAFLYLDGLEGIKGMHVLEVPGGGVTLPERHLFHEFYLVFEGRGTAETWLDSDPDHKQVVEWGPGSLFYFPPNVTHRVVNGTGERVLILAANNAPPLYNMLRDREFIFANDYVFSAHYSGDSEFYKFNDTVYAVPNSKRAQSRSNYFPDIINAQLPLDNQRVPGYRRIQPAFRGFERDHVGFVGEFPIGRYSRAHHHAAGAVLVCLKGGGYTFTWPVSCGMTPWRDGHADKVKVLRYQQGGLVAAAPGGGEWFHQHFAIAQSAFRVYNYWGGPVPIGLNNLNMATGKSGNLNIRDGGNSIAYDEEDPYIRERFEEELAKVGMKSDMPADVYEQD